MSPKPSIPHLIPNEGIWAGRVWLPASSAPNGLAGPRVVGAIDGRVFDLSRRFQTFSDLVNCGAPAKEIPQCLGSEIASVEELQENSVYTNRAATLAQETRPCLLAPNDILATKACGVTFIRSLLERVIEEKAKGDPQAASQVRQAILDTLGNDLSKVKPGSEETVALKAKLIEQGIWSQYLEVGIGPDAEVFTKAQPMASVGYGVQIGIHPKSKWNNPEPEIVLAVSNKGNIQGATLGNDVNLRDFEGRSALLLGEAKDQNGSCSIGPFVRLFDESFCLDDVKTCEIGLEISGEDGFHTSGSNKMIEISRSPEELVRQAIGDNHQYPDGFMLFLGTMFAPTEDRDRADEGFTHHIGDRVTISSPKLGQLTNWVAHTNAIPRWEFGIRDLIDYLQRSRVT
ncbi:fumarylacetoacetate hydrolase family protein [Pelagicoccus sp. SDUM812005]|uniref:fumarylacetoacetate hydrolase family protein n=1 Tax=Pelagicoccus sp. SDUM812005 TaxID=3041257 RepID=UPI002810412D|nr:fumarylacetoacetate hydrolase family protein [Pelagicoccus sp. SDUM812005]MDQ8180496.1 fumarylacetoacetate hydrolase family protein [Pelagicoccus sp. SDUM812005]